MKRLLDNWWGGFDVVRFMGRLGLKTLGAKLFAGIMALTTAAICVVSVVSYLSFSSAIDSGEQLQGIARAAAEASDLFLSENIKYARAVANDEQVVAAAERAAREAERAGIKSPPAGDLVGKLEEQFRETRAVKRDQAADEFLREKQRSRGVIERMFFTDKYGLNAGMTQLTEDSVQSDEGWWRETMRLGTYVEDVKYDKPTETFAIEICVAVLSKNEGPVGVLKVKYNLRDVQDYISRFKQYESGEAYAISESGRVVLHREPQLRNVEIAEFVSKVSPTDAASLESALVAAQANQHSGTIYYEGRNPVSKQIETRLASFWKSKELNSLSPGFNWTFVVDNSKNEVFAPAYRMLRGILIAGLAAIVLFGGLALAFVKSFSKKIERLLAATEEVRAGNLDARVDIETNDELEKVGQGFNVMMDRLAEMVRNEKAHNDRLRETEQAMERSLSEFLSIVSSVSEGDLTRRGDGGEDTLGRIILSVNGMLNNFSAMLTEVKQIALSVSSNATEILAASEQIAVGSQRQADEVTNTSSGVEEMAASMTQVSKNAESSADAARRAAEMAELGDRSVRDTSEAMLRIDSAVQQTAAKMRLLGSRSSEISEIIDLIDEIASQTNLLALNAAIEAAHAGEAGLGFSVVAEEIRKLAERSARATRDVGSLIKSIQGETQEALSAMELGMKEVMEGSNLAASASRALRDISDAVRQSSELMEEISAASEEQARVTTNLAAAMQTISSITLETSAGAHQTAQTIEGMVGLSEQLNRAISQFRVKDDFVHPFSYDVPGPAGNGGRSDRTQPARD
jgi:methyl-accepting chemotaxis protein